MKGMGENGGLNWLQYAPAGETFRDSGEDHETIRAQTYDVRTGFFVFRLLHFMQW
jgi:hypothetical protein